MIDPDELQIIAQLIDNMEILSDKLERAYNKNSSEEFNKAKNEILENQSKIAEIIGKNGNWRAKRKS